jgi:hypothetical protein
LSGGTGTVAACQALWKVRVNDTQQKQEESAFGCPKGLQNFA